jgi:thiamine-phosphate pyrophosphorylase
MILYAISDRRLSGKDGFRAHAARMIAAGVDWFQLREKDLSDRSLLDNLAELCSIPRDRECKILVNGRVDVALAAGADGVHLTSTGPPTAVVRGLCPQPFLVVRSCHQVSEVIRAARDGADAVTFGPVFPTPSKAAHGPPAGVEALREACASVEVPVLALGGVDESNAFEALDCGARGLAAIRLFWGMGNPAEGIPALRERLSRDHP